MSFQKAQVQIGSVSAVVFVCQESNDYYYSLTSAADLLGKPPSSPAQFLASKAFKASEDKGFTPAHFSDETGAKYKLLSCNVVLAYLIHHVTRGDKRALEVVMALTQESLEVRAARAFDQLTQPKLDQIQQKTNEELATDERRSAKDEHCAFQHACNALGYQPAKAHDYITKLVFGSTAKESRELPPVEYSDEVWSDETVGINHQASPEQMKIYRQIKLRFLTYRKGTMEEKIDRAYQAITKNLKLG